jgi:hypothetical protein
MHTEVTTGTPSFLMWFVEQLHNEVVTLID